MKDICIIVPVYNAEQYLVDCLNSILNQTYKEWKCVLVNDGSTDNSQSIIDSYCVKDSRFECYIKENEKSAAKAREYAEKRIKSEWVISVDADDAIAPDCVQRLVERQEETGADIITGHLIFCRVELEGEYWRLPVESVDLNKVITGREACLLTIGGWQIGGVSLRKKILSEGLEVGPYMNSDEFLQRQRLLRANKVAFADADYYVRRNVGTSDKVSVRMFDRTLVDMQLEQFVYDNFPEREDKIKALAWQRLFNLIYLCADYQIHKTEFTLAEQEHAISILEKSYQALDKRKSLKYYPLHSLTLLSFSFNWFMLKSKWYVQYKRSHRGFFYYQ